MRILFICTGNIFRSLTAEHALRRALSDQSRVQVASAGTEDFPHVVWPVVRNYLRVHGFDVSAHQRRTLTRQILDAGDLCVAMSTEHQQFVRNQFARDLPLFTEVCGMAPEPLPDVDVAVPDYATNELAAAAHIRTIIDQIVVLTPRLASRVVQRDSLLRQWLPLRPSEGSST
jgi:protein-tyrosine phosphatase